MKNNMPLKIERMKVCFQLLSKKCLNQLKYPVVYLIFKVYSQRVSCSMLSILLTELFYSALFWNLENIFLGDQESHNYC